MGCALTVTAPAVEEEDDMLDAESGDERPAEDARGRRRPAGTVRCRRQCCTQRVSRVAWQTSMQSHEKGGPHGRVGETLTTDGRSVDAGRAAIEPVNAPLVEW